MKDLDQTKIYNLEKLNIKQFLTLLSRVNLDSSRFIGMENPCIVFYNDLWNATEETMQCEESVDARELFEEGVMKIKNLDQTKVYDLSDLNEKQREAIYDWLVKNDISFRYFTKRGFILPDNDILIYQAKGWNWYSKDKYYLKFNEINKNDIINALELFKEEPIFKDNPHLSISWSNIEIKYDKI